VIYKGAAMSAIETGLLAVWERERRSRVTIGELRQLLGAETRNVVTGLVEKSLLERIAPGLFLIHPFHSLSQPRAVSAPVVAAALLSDEPYYLGGRWAFSVHRLTQQVYGSIVDADAIREHRPRRLRTARLVSHVLQVTSRGRHRGDRGMTSLPPLPDRELLADLCLEMAATDGVHPFAIEKDFYLTRQPDLGAGPGVWGSTASQGRCAAQQGMDLGYRRMSEDVGLVIPGTPIRHGGIHAAAINPVHNVLRD
jgi:hypothetical protein